MSNSHSPHDDPERARLAAADHGVPRQLRGPYLAHDHVRPRADPIADRPRRAAERAMREAGGHPVPRPEGAAP